MSFVDVPQLNLSGAFQRILRTTGDILCFPFDLFDLAVNLKFGVANKLVQGFFRRAGELPGSTDNAVSVHLSEALWLPRLSRRRGHER